MMTAQVRKTGGLFFDLDKTKFIVDPGPGSLVHAVALGLQPEKWNGVLLSHLHPDHAADVNAYLDGIREPFLVAEEHCVFDKKKTKSGFDYYPCVTFYHREKSKLYAVKPGDEVEAGGLRINAIKTAHNFPAVGFRIKSDEVDVGYTSDGAYYKGMEKHYDGCNILVINIVIPKGQIARRPGYMGVDGVISLLNGMKKKPDLAVLTHFSFWFMRSNLWKQEKIIQDATKVRTIHSEDFMSIDLKTLTVTKYRETKSAKVSEFVDK